MSASAQPRIIVVGAGLVGLALAWRLLREGAAVTVLDRAPPGEGASFGNAGAISSSSVLPVGMPGIVKQVPGMLLDPAAPLRVPPLYGLKALPWFLRFIAASKPERIPAISEALAGLHTLALEQHRALAAEVGAPELIKANGHLYLYRDEAQLAKDESSWALRKEYGAVVEPLDREGILALEPEVGPAYRIGRFMPHHAHCFDPHAYCLAIAAAFQRSGGVLLRETVEAITVSGGRVTGVLTDQGSHECDELALAAGAYSARLAAPLGYRIPLETQRGYHVMLPRPGISLSRILVPVDKKVFLTPMAGGIRVAGTVEFGGLERPPTPARAAILPDHARQTLPAVSLEGVQDFWMGHRPCLPDSVPVIGPAKRLPGLWFAFGHGHLGVTGAPATAELLAPAMLGRPVNRSLEPYAAERFD
ncbi:FAD-dependent oxidoreductase [Acetobacteraceae bacterium H6797]|nr:FAD-dependent oxidoreductase [Acetobacteraceae bacterium H6797]